MQPAQNASATPPLDYCRAEAAHAQLLSHLHGQCFERGWTPEEFAALLTTPGYRAGLLSRADGAASDDGPVGFVMTRQMAGEAEIITLGICPPFRGRGWAAELLSRVLAELDPAVQNVFLEVAVTNEPAIRLYRRFGFETLRTRKSYYQTVPQRTDALVMKRTVGSAPGGPQAGARA